MIRRIQTSFFLLYISISCAASAQQKASPVPTVKPLSFDEGSNLVVMRISGEPITEKQVVDAINALLSQKQLPAESQQQHNVALFQGAVDNLVIQVLLKKEARQQNLVPDPEKVDEQLKRISGQFPSQEEFQKAMAAQGFTEAQLKNNVEESLRMQQVLDRAVKDVPETTDAEIEEFYSDNSQKFSHPEQVHAAHIIFLVTKDTTSEQKEEIKKKLEWIRSEIESNKITFADAAAKYSQEAGTAPKGGDLGFFGRGEMVKPFEEAAFNGEPASLSQVIETPFGLHIVRIIEKRPEGKSSLEEVRSEIKGLLDQTRKRKAVQQYVNNLKSNASIEKFMTPEEFIKRHMAAP